MTARKSSRNAPDPTATPSAPAAKPTPAAKPASAAPAATAALSASKATAAPSAPAGPTTTPAKRKKTAEKRADASPRGRGVVAVAASGRCGPSTTPTGGGCSPVSTMPRTICSARTWSAAVWRSGCSVRTRDR